MTERRTGIVVFAHGSRIESANHAVRDVSDRLASSGRYMVEPAFLELGEPDLAGAVERLVARGVGRIVVIPYFLTLGTHLQRDLPRLAADVAARYEKVEIHVTSPLDGHPALLQALLDRASQADAAAKKTV
jgi:sirohydrochlorin ferrochelatase